MRLPLLALLALSLAACFKPSPAEQARRDADRRFLDAAAAQPGAVKLDSGVVYLSSGEGNGIKPKPRDHVKVRYTGRLTDGTVFDASAQHGGSIDMPLDGAIACWSTGVTKMSVGGKATLTCPADTAYGERGVQGLVPAGAVLQFDIELVAITASIH